MNFRIACRFILIALVSTGPAVAGVRLPLGGYCRPGKYFPIEMTESPATHFEAAGAIDVMMPSTQTARSIVPMLIVDVPGDLHWSGGSLPLHVPGEHERLIGSTADTDLAAALFPGDHILPIHLDPSDPLPGPPAAWEALNAIMVDADTMARITPGQRSALLAGGTTLAVTGDNKPSDNWPWQRRGPLWVLAYTPRGPVDQLVVPDAYSPTFAWSTGWPVSVRRQIAAVAVLLFLLIAGVTLLRNRWVLPALAVIVVSTIVSAAAWQRSFGSTEQAGGDVIVSGNGLVQKDAWVFERARATGRAVVPWAGWLHPIFSSRSALAGCDMTLNVSENGSASFELSLVKDQTIAFVRREVRPDSLPAISNPCGTPMRESARTIYLGHGDRIEGETPAAEGRWPAAVIRRSSSLNSD